MSNFTQMIHRIIKTKGTTLYSLRVVTSSGFVDSNNISKGPTSTTKDYPLSSFPDSSFGFKGYSSSQINNELIKTGDILLHVDPTDLSVTPDVSDLIVKNSDIWKIKNIYTYEIYENTALYSLHIRK